MMKSQNLRKIMYGFITATLVFSFASIALWNGIDVAMKLAVAGIFCFFDAIAFALLMANQEDVEKQDIRQQEKELLSHSVYPTLPDTECQSPMFYCPKCKEYKTAGQVWGGSVYNKCCMKCDTLTVPVFAGKFVECPKCHALNNFHLHNYCWKCQAVLHKPDAPKDEHKEVQA